MNFSRFESEDRNDKGEQRKKRPDPSDGEVSLISHFGSAFTRFNDRPGLESTEISEDSFSGLVAEAWNRVTPASNVDELSVLSEESSDLDTKPSALSHPDEPKPKPPPPVTEPRFVEHSVSQYHPYIHKICGEKPPTPPQNSRASLEIEPGIFEHIRGADETQNCIRNDFYAPALCFDCDQMLFCVMDAKYVLCPTCRVVNPMDEVTSQSHGIGLGFTIDQLAEWQAEILSGRL